jgi:trk system potassium uptake protein
MPSPKNGGSASLRLINGFATLIALGTILLMLPISSKTGQPASFVNAIFTATSAICVTGLIVVDTGDYWSSFGQGVILALIQVGGFGFMTSATLFLLALGRRIGLQEKLRLGESMGVAPAGDMVGIVRRLAIFTIFVEIAGAMVFYPRFYADNSPGIAVWKAIFHSISAFNNAGFDLFGNFQSLSGYQGDSLVIMATAALVFLGGISFLVLTDVFQSRNFRRLTLDSKLVLSTTLLLLAIGTLVILIVEFNDRHTLGVLSNPQKLLNAFFQSVAVRTAGFSTIDMANVADYALFFTMLLMFIGGASGSTAGGIKVNTFAVLLATIVSSIKGKEHPGAFGREFTAEQIHRAIAVVMLSLGLIFVIVFLLTVTEDFRFLNLIFETVSAFGTVGLSTGITPGLSIAGKLILAATMFAGRLGPLTLALVLTQRQQPAQYRHPKEGLRIG